MPAPLQTDAPTNGTAAAATNPQAARVAVSRGEAILLLVLVLSGLGLWAAADRFVTSYMKDDEPREEQFQLARSLPRLQAGLAMTQEEMKSTQEQLIKTRLELAGDEAEVAALEAFPPAPKPAATPEEDPRTAALRKRDAAARLANSLVARLGELQGAADRLGAEVEGARGRVGGDFYRSQWNFRMRKALYTLGLAALALWGLLWAIGLLRRAKWLRGKVPGLSADGSLMWWTVAGLLLVLFGYEAFEVVGAALAGVAVMLVFLARVPWTAARAAAAKAGAERVTAEAGAKAGAAGGV